MITVEFTNAASSGQSKPPAGGYILEVKTVEHNEAKQSIKLELDIDSGKFKDYYQDLYNSFGWWALTDYKSYRSEGAKSFLYQFIQALEKSNDTYKWDGDETKWPGLKVGAVLGYEEYIGNDGQTKQKVRIKAYKSLADIVGGKFVVPELKKLGDSKPAAEVVNKSVQFEPVDDEDHPF